MFGYIKCAAGLKREFVSQSSEHMRSYILLQIHMSE